MVRNESLCDKLRKALAQEQHAERRLYRSSADAAFKLEVHFPTVTKIAEMLAPEDEVLQTAAEFHDCGRIPQLESTGSFNDGLAGGSTDHHVIGYNRFTKIVEDVLSKEEREQNVAILQQIGKAILLHGMRGKALEQEFAALDTRTAEIVDTVSIIDDVANGAQCAGYLLRECQEHAKNVSRGGFIPDENAISRAVSPNVMELFRKSETFDRNAECWTYPDYAIFGAFLATRSLKNPETRDIAVKVMSQPIVVWRYNQWSKLATIKFPDAVTALDYVLDSVMDESYAETAKGILRDFFEKGACVD